ncbi:hypothetical protein Fuma_06315 [Fuerstiella marisgermanici]|uniref:Uncharacterized protein n=1 Tax=Fuerstiella marisgermanici TaxID=1891926 RepID=A0A1P8WRF5_9PLAN|nr:hypothetical protein Fuma_06315 [Fuerstiella marisgermanici]
MRPNKKMQPSCRRRFSTWQISRGNRLIISVRRPSANGITCTDHSNGAIYAAMLSRNQEPTLHIGCLVALVFFSTYVALVTYPFGAWKFGAALGALAFLSIFLRVGWFVPFAIAGTYAGIMLDARVKGGTIESQMQETIVSIVVGTVSGFAIGVTIDSMSRLHPRVQNADEQTDEREPE